MTIEEAKNILGNNYDNIPSDKIEEWINASNGIAEVFLQQFVQQLIKKGIYNENGS
jgi:hypothetical protein